MKENISKNKIYDYWDVLEVYSVFVIKWLSFNENVCKRYPEQFFIHKDKKFHKDETHNTNIGL